MTQEEIKEIEEKIERLTALKNELKNEEQAIKLTMNSIYGAIGNNFFVCFNPDVAESVTLQGQDLIKYSEMVLNRYFHEFWHLDKELHEKLGLTTVKRVAKPLIIYSDTDSVFSDSKILIQNELGEEFMISIQDFFKDLLELEDVKIDQKGNEIIEPSKISSLNYKEGNLVFSGIKKIIRHKVRKPKWRIRTECSKEVIVTNDHSVTVFRDGEKIHLKPSEINIEKDEILSIDVDI